MSWPEKKLSQKESKKAFLLQSQTFVNSSPIMTLANSIASGFSVRHWAAWAPDRQSQHDWLDWCGNPSLPAGEASPAASHVPALIRRRTHRLGRMALEALHTVAGNLPNKTPIVYASRHGESIRSQELIEELLTENGVSPQSFSLSVHNAIIGIHTITQASRANVTALAGSHATGSALLTEATGLLASGNASVLVVACDEVLPDVYTPYVDEPQAPFAWAAELVPGHDFIWDTGFRPDETHRLPELLATLHFLIAPSGQGSAIRHWRRQENTPTC